MSDLDEKLDESISGSLSIWKARPGETAEDAPNKVQWFRPNGGELWFFAFDKEAVKQAFVDTGWSYFPQKFNVYTTEKLGFKPVEPGTFAELMTGQAWYDRFEKEMMGKVFPAHVGDRQVQNAVNECMLTAKIAAGIEPDTN